MKELTFTVYPDGRPSQLTIAGISGPGCKAELQRVIDAMNGEVVSEELTPEYYQAESLALKQEG